MRTTIVLDPDVVAAIESRRRATGAGLSETVNELARAGMQAAQRTRTFRQRSVDLGIRIDVSNVAAALDDLDGPDGLRSS